MPGRIRTVFMKELRETFRDRRVILGVIVSPLVITPLLLLTVGGTVIRKEISSKKEALAIGVVAAGALPGLEARLAEDRTLRVQTVASSDEAETAVRDQRLRAALVVPHDAAATLARGASATLTVILDESNEKSRTAKGRLDDVVRGLKNKEVERRLRASGLEPSALTPLETKPKSVATAAKVSGSVLGIILPYILCLTAAFGGMTSAFDLCAGEKERGTMETLLVSPASRHEIILGKLGAIGVVSVIAAVCSVTGLLLAVLEGARFGGALGVKLAISYPSVLAMLAMVIPMVMMTSSLMLLISTFARNQKEAQAYAFPFMIVIVLPAVFSAVLGPENHLALSLVPILNTALAMKQVLSGIFNLPFLAVALASSAAYALLAMRVVVAMFERESILFRT